MSVPDLTNKVLAFREWNAREVEGKWILFGPYYDEFPWRPGNNKAICLNTPVLIADSMFRESTEMLKHDAPDKQCHCGLYGLHNLPFHFNLFMNLPLENDVGLPFSVGGITESWGQIELYGNGIRAEYSRILALIEPSAGYYHLGKPGYYKKKNLELLQQIAKEYNVPIIPFAKAQYWRYLEDRFPNAKPVSAQMKREVQPEEPVLPWVNVLEPHENFGEALNEGFVKIMNRLEKYQEENNGNIPNKE